MAQDLACDLLIAHASWSIALSILTFAAYALDKRRAKLGKRRTPERTLHRLGWLGGWPGAWAGRALLRHKSRKRGFAVRLAVAGAVHLGCAGVLGWLAVR